MSLKSSWDCGSVIPRSPFNSFLLWTLQSGGTEHNFFWQRHLIPYASRCRGQIDIFKWCSFISKIPENFKKIYLRLSFNVSFATQLIITDVYPNVWKLFRFKVSTTYTLFICAEGGALWEFESLSFSLHSQGSGGLVHFGFCFPWWSWRLEYFSLFPCPSRGVTERSLNNPVRDGPGTKAW